MKKLLLLFSLFTFSFITAQNDEQSLSMESYLISNGTADYYSNVVDKMFDFLRSEFEGQHVSELVWTEMGEVKIQALTDLTEMIIQAYESHFSKDELQTMLDFYNTDTGINLLAQKQLSPDEIKIKDEFNMSSVGQKISVSTESLNNLLQKITQEWSADLFQNVVHKLEQKGFTRGE